MWYRNIISAAKYVNLSLFEGYDEERMVDLLFDSVMLDAKKRILYSEILV
jgi:hypothetical protein